MSEISTALTNSLGLVIFPLQTQNSPFKVNMLYSFCKSNLLPIKLQCHCNDFMIKVLKTERYMMIEPIQQSVEKGNYRL